MKKLSLLIFLLLSTTILTTAQLNLKYVDNDTSLTITSDNQIIVGKAGPVFLADMDSIDFELDRLSLLDINTDWIQSISVHKGSSIPAEYDTYFGKDLIVIVPKSNYKKEFKSLMFDIETRKRMIEK